MTKKATETPYLNAKKEYNEREGSLNASHQLNKIINILCLLIALSAVGGLVYYRYLLQLVPFVVEVDQARPNLRRSASGQGGSRRSPRHPRHGRPLHHAGPHGNAGCDAPAQGDLRSVRLSRFFRSGHVQDERVSGSEIRRESVQTSR